MTFLKTIKEMFYYKEWCLFFGILLVSFKIFFLSWHRKDHLLGAFLPSERRDGKRRDRDRIVRYINFCLFLQRRLGLRYTCFTRSLLFYHVLKQNGFDIKINFGTKKKGDVFVGHCWIEQKEKDTCSDYEVVCSYS